MFSIYPHVCSIWAFVSLQIDSVFQFIVWLASTPADFGGEKGKSDEGDGGSGGERREGGAGREAFLLRVGVLERKKRT